MEIQNLGCHNQNFGVTERKIGKDFNHEDGKNYFLDFGKYGGAKNN